MICIKNLDNILKIVKNISDEYVKLWESDKLNEDWEKESKNYLNQWNKYLIKGVVNTLENGILNKMENKKYSKKILLMSIIATLTDLVGELEPNSTDEIDDMISTCLLYNELQQRLSKDKK